MARLLECSLELVTELNEVLHHLDLSIELECAGVVVKKGLDQAFTVAFVEELFDFGPTVGLAGHVECEEFGKSLEF